MMARYLVDTDWVIDYLNGRPATVERLAALQSQGLSISVISLAELYEGVHSSRDPEGSLRALDDFLRTVTVVPLDDRVCDFFGKERGRLRRLGKLIGDFDLLIGATAVRHSMVLLTNNQRHFELVDGLTVVSL